MSIFTWFFNQGATVIVPVAVIILGLIFRVSLKKTFVSALKMGVGFAALYALIGVGIGAMSSAGNVMSARFGTGLSVIDVGWGVYSGFTFAAPFTLPVIAGLVGLNVLLILFGLIKTLNVDVFNQWQFVFVLLIVLVTTNSWPLAIAFTLIIWFLTLKLADWTAPWIQKYYNMPGISIPHMPTIAWAPVGFLLNSLWDRIPVIKDINIDSETAREKFGIFGEPIMVGFLAGLIFGGFAYISNPAAGGLGDQISKLIQLALTMSVFVVLIPRACELIVAGLLPLSDGIRSFISKKMPGRDFYIGLDVAVLVGKIEHIALGTLLVPLIYLVAVLIPGNRILPLADAAGFMIFFSVFLINTNNGNLFRGILNCCLVALPITFILSNLIIPASMKIAAYTNFKIPNGAKEVAALSPGSNIFIYSFYKIAGAIKGVETSGSLLLAIGLIVAWSVILYVVRKKPAEMAEKLSK